MNPPSHPPAPEDASAASEDPSQTTGEAALEPQRLIRRSALVLRAGVMMLGAGTSSLRVRALMRRAADALGLDGLEAAISYTDITLTVREGGIFRTQVAETTSPGVNAHRIAQLQALTQELPSRVNPDDLEARLDKIANTKPLYPLWLLALFVGLASVSVTALQNGGWREVAAVFPAAVVAFWLSRLFSRYQLNHLAGVLLAAVTASGGFLLITHLIDLAAGDTSPRMAAGFIGAALFLIPGFPLVTGGLDLTRIDLTAGIPRTVYAAMVLLAITIGVWVVASAGGVTTDSVPPSAATAWLAWAIRVAASFGAVFGWALMFNSPMRVAVTSGVIAIAGNVPRLLLLDAGIENHVATFFGCVIIGLACAVAGRIFALEKIIMTVPTLLVVIPGASALQTMLYFDSADTVSALSHGVATVLAVIAMVAGLSAARMLTDPEWTFTRQDPPTLAGAFREGTRRIWGRR